jgi:hypothetical protein
MAFAIRHPGQVVPFIRLAFMNDLTLAFLPARYFNVMHATSVFTDCPIEVIEGMFCPCGPPHGSRSSLRITFYRTNDAGYQVHHEDFYYRAETLIRLAAQHGLSARLTDDCAAGMVHGPWPRQNARSR